jgi:hypothetical protein
LGCGHRIDVLDADARKQGRQAAKHGRSNPDDHSSGEVFSPVLFLVRLGLFENHPYHAGKRDRHAQRVDRAQLLVTIVISENRY